MTTLLNDFPFHGASDDLKRHLQHVINGEYQTFVNSFLGNPRILDLGANIGSFAYWALAKFPNAHVISFEPNSTNCKNYIKNMQDSGIQAWQYSLIKAAVLDSNEETISLYESEVNAGMHSIHSGLTNTEDPATFTAPIVNPRALPDCQILKMDTEGCEVQILKAYLERSSRPEQISFEFHSLFDHTTLDELLAKDYILSSGRIIHPSMGTLNYVRNDLVETAFRQSGLPL